MGLPLSCPLESWRKPMVNAAKRIRDSGLFPRFWLSTVLVYPGGDVLDLDLECCVWEMFIFLS